MCGRFRLGKGREALKKYFDADTDLDWEPRYNIAPTQDVVTVRQDAKEPRRVLSLMRWGLVPYWSKDAAGGARMINARSETVARVPAFRDALRSRRCLVPADGFYEWQRAGQSKQPFCFSLQGEGIFAFAGLWERWKSQEGSILETCSILTTTPNDLVRDIHDRMPVILPPDAYDLWLDPGFTRREGILEVLKPLSASTMKRFPVSTRVNDVRNEDAEVAAPLQASGQSPQLSMFSSKN